MIVRNRLKSIRHRLEIDTQTEFAALLGVTRRPGYISRKVKRENKTGLAIRVVTPEQVKSDAWGVIV